MERTPQWNNAVDTWKRKDPKKFAELKALAKDSKSKSSASPSDFDALFYLSPTKESSNEVIARIKRWQPVMASARGIIVAGAHFDPYKAARVICSLVLFGVDLVLNSMNPEDRVKILDNLLLCGTTIKEGISFETNFTKKNHPAAAERIDNLHAILREQYCMALDLIYEIRHSCKEMKDAYPSPTERVKDFLVVRGHKLAMKLTARTLAWDNEGKAITRFKTDWSADKKSLDDAVVYDGNTATVRDWIKDRDDPENTIEDLEDLEKDVVLGNMYKDAAEWFLEDSKFKDWCFAIQASRATTPPNGSDGAVKTSKRVLWLRGGLGTGKTTLLYRAFAALRDNPEMKPADVEMRVIRYFCNAKKTRPPSFKTILCALTSRLSVRSDFTLADAAQTCYDINTSVIESTGAHLKTREELFANLTAASSQPIVFVVDALDECVNTAATEDFLKFMSKNMKAASNLYLLCSSQKHVDVDTYFGPGNHYAGEDILEVIDVSAQRSATAMKAFITGELKRRKYIARDSIFYDSKYTFLSDLNESLTKYAHGMFEWVRVWLNICIPIRDIAHKTIKSETLAKKLLRELRDDVMDKPEEYQAINKAYQRLWDRNEVAGDEILGTRIRLFKFILATFQPQTLDTLSVALRIQSDSFERYPKPEDVKLLCSDFLEGGIGAGSRALQFVHNAARGFILKKCRESESEEDDTTSALRQSHLSIVTLYRTLMESVEHQFWQVMEVNPLDLENAARSNNGANFFRDRMLGTPTWPLNKESKSIIDFYHYISEWGLRHCKEAARKQSISDPTWREILQCVIMERKSAFAYTLMKGSPLHTYFQGTIYAPTFTKRRGEIYLLYAHILTWLNIIHDDDLRDLRSRQNSVSKPEHGISLHTLFSYASHDGTFVGAELPLHKNTALHLACWRGNVTAVEFILEVTFRSIDKIMDLFLLRHTSHAPIPLVVAIKQHDFKTAKLLLEFEKKHALVATDDSTAGNTSFVSKQWVSDYNTVNGRFVRGKCSLLNWAIEDLNQDEVCSLLKVALPTSVDMLDVRHNTEHYFPPETALQFACQRGWARLVRFLVEECNADIYADPESTGRTPFKIAEGLEDKEILAYFKSRSAGVASA